MMLAPPCFAATQTRAPTSDISESGTWAGGAAGTRWQSVDDHPDSGDTDHLTHGTTAGDLQLGFSAFTVPAGATAISVQVIYYDYKNAAQGAAWGARLRIGSTPTTHDSGTHNPANGVGNITLRTDDFGTTNPKSSAAWTVDDVNGVGTNGLVGFGLRATDANPTCVVSSIMVQVTYTAPAGCGGLMLLGVGC
jgi:hypothetical protein